MSVIENIQKLLKTRSVQPDDNMVMASAGGAGDSLAANSLVRGDRISEAEAEKDVFAASTMSATDDSMLDDTELLSLPVLGLRTLAQHQKILVALLALAVVALAFVTFFALSKSDRVAQQVAATGQTLMQSQRLAKSASQALVGSAQAFPDVRESADVLIKTVRGMKSGDESLRLAAVNDELLPELEKVTPLI